MSLEMRWSSTEEKFTPIRGDSRNASQGVSGRRIRGAMRPDCGPPKGEHRQKDVAQRRPPNARCRGMSMAGGHPPGGLLLLQPAFLGDVVPVHGPSRIVAPHTSRRAGPGLGPAWRRGVLRGAPFCDRGVRLGPLRRGEVPPNVLAGPTGPAMQAGCGGQLASLRLHVRRGPHRRCPLEFGV